MSKLTLEEIYKLASEFWSDPEDIAQFTAMAMGESGGITDEIANDLIECSLRHLKHKNFISG